MDKLLVPRASVNKKPFSHVINAKHSVSSHHGIQQASQLQFDFYTLDLSIQYVLVALHITAMGSSSMPVSLRNRLSKQKVTLTSSQLKAGVDV